MKKRPREITVVFIKSRSVWKTRKLKPVIEHASLYALEDKLIKLGYMFEGTDGYSHAWFTLADTK